MNLRFCFLFSMFIVSAFAYAGEYIPKGAYLIDRNGRKSDLTPLLRVRRGSSYATSYSSSSSGNNGAANIPQFFFDNGFLGGNLNPAANPAFTGGITPEVFSRFGEDVGTGVHVSGSAQGPRGAFSSSSSSIDSNGKIKYSVQSGKY